MEISSATRVGPKYRFYPNNAARKRSFVVVPREMIDQSEMGHIEADWTRVVAFGDLAEAINKLRENGVELFKVKKGRIRNNDLKRDDNTIYESQEIVAESLDMRGFVKLMKEVKGTGFFDEASLPDAG